MKRSRQLSILAFCTVAALGIGMTSCGDETPSVTRPKLGDACSADNPCDTGLKCGDDGKCVEGAAQLGEACGAAVVCADGLECGAEGKCVEKSGSADEKALLGEDCGADKSCADGLECGAEGKCVEKTADPGPGPNEDPCATANCPDGKACLAGRCYDEACIVDGAEMVCDSGKMCSKGECVDDGCQDKTCDEGEVCSKGVCEDAVCLQNAIVCNNGATCVKGNCVDNECLSQTCDAGLTCSKGDCVFPACVGKAACDPGKTCNEAGECVFGEAPALNATPDTTETDENGGSAAIALTLNNPPSKEVSVKCVLSPEDAADEVEVSCDGILFDASNYGEAQAVHVTGIPDNVIDEDVKYSLTITTVSEDPEFNGLEKVIEMVNKNVDTVGVNVTAPERLTTTESGGSESFSVVLKAKPASDVTIVVSTSNAEYGEIEGAVENKLTITFTPENWNTPQEIKVVGKDDTGEQNETEHVYQVIFENTVSEDVNYNGLEIKPIDVINLDNDIADAFLSSDKIETLENGDAVDVVVRLGLAPKKDVEVSAVVFTTKDADEESKEAVVVGESKFVFNSTNFKEGHVILIKGQMDNRIDGDQDYFVRLRFGSDDSQYKDLQYKWIEGKNIDTDEAGLKFDYEGLKVSENGDSVNIGVTLASIPTGDVTVSVASSNKREVMVEPATLTFTPETWNVPQTVTATGMDDVVIDGDQTVPVNFKLASEDSHFNAQEAKLDIVNADNDVAAIVVASTGAEILESSNATVEFKVMLSAQPQHGVDVKLKSPDESELKILGQSMLVFTEENWNVPQTVILQVVDDNVADGTQTVRIELSSISEDPDFDGLKAQTQDYNILDNESASVTLTAAKTTLVPGDYSTSVSVSLSAPPISDVVVTLATTNAETAALSNKTLTFTTENWNTPQSVTLTDANPQKAKSAKSVETISAVAAGEGQYNGRESNKVEVTLYAFQEKTVAFAKEVQSVALLPGKYKLEVWGGRGCTDASGGKTGYGGYGGYATGTYNMVSAQTLYIVTGGAGTNAWEVLPAAYNGGGHNSDGSGAGGGGATHIATSNKGELFNYVNAKSDVLIVAGGGGAGGDYADGGAGGGQTGLAGKVYSGTSGAGGTQTTGYAFGKGEPANGQSPAGGGGWYGGYRGQNGVNAGGGGGSGYIGGVTGGSMQTGVNNSTGYAKITLLD